MNMHIKNTIDTDMTLEQFIITLNERHHALGAQSAELIKPAWSHFEMALKTLKSASEKVPKLDESKWFLRHRMDSVRQGADEARQYSKMLLDEIDGEQTTTPDLKELAVCVDSFARHAYENPKILLQRVLWKIPTVAKEPEAPAFDLNDLSI